MKQGGQKGYKCGVCNKPLGHGQVICGEHWQMISQQEGYPITNKKMRELHNKLFPIKETKSE